MLWNTLWTINNMSKKTQKNPTQSILRATEHEHQAHGDWFQPPRFWLASYVRQEWEFQFQLVSFADTHTQRRGRRLLEVWEVRLISQQADKACRCKEERREGQGESVLPQNTPWVCVWDNSTRRDTHTHLFSVGFIVQLAFAVTSSV